MMMMEGAGKLDYPFTEPKRAHDKEIQELNEFFESAHRYRAGQGREGGWSYG
jgi:hypothetical protein